MVWHRALSYTLLGHAFILGFFVFTLRPPAGLHRTEVLFLGPILRLHEVSSEGVLWAPPADQSRVELVSDIGLRPRAWFKGLQVDKPELFENIPTLGDDRILRFSGERVELDDKEDLSAGDDIPPPLLMKLRLERP